MKRTCVGLLLLAGVAGCDSQLSGPPPAENSVQTAQLPFDQPAQKGIISTGALVPRAITVAVGTPLTVRLEDELSSATATPGQKFKAVLDEPLVVEGETVVERGAVVQGRVLTVGHSGRSHAGYLRMALSSITVAGNPVPVHTSSLFVLAGKHSPHAFALSEGGVRAMAASSLVGSSGGADAASGKQDVEFAADRRLSFRLTQAMVVRK